MKKEKSSPSSKKHSNTSSSSTKKSFDGLLAKIERIEKKLDLINTMSRSMPVVLLTTGAIVGSIFYISMTAKMPETTPSRLPQTGDEISTNTEDFVIEYPKNNASIILPYSIKGTAQAPLADAINSVQFWIQENAYMKSKLDTPLEYNAEDEYSATIQHFQPGAYTIWAEIQTTDNSIYFSNPTTIYIAE